MDIIDKVKKLLELSKANNSPEEAASAAARASELMFKYQIGEADLDIGEEDREVDDVVDESLCIDDKSRLDRWKSFLAAAVARGFGANVYTWKTGRQVKYQIVGLKTVVQTVSYMFAYLTAEVNRLADAGYEALDDFSFATVNAKTWKNSFRMGAVGVIYKRLDELRKSQQAELATKEATTAIALYKSGQERSDDYYELLRKSKGLKTASKSNTSLDGDAYAAGRRAGEAVNLGGNRALGGPTGKLEN